MNWADMRQFIEVLKYQARARPEASAEDDALWQAVQAHRTYRQAHPADEPERYASGAEFLKGVADL